MQAVPRQGYFLGKLVKSVKKGVKGLAKGVKKFGEHRRNVAQYGNPLQVTGTLRQ